MAYNPDCHHRRSIRLLDYDYSSVGQYFVTICTKNREMFFGDVVDGKMILNQCGKIARQCCQNIPLYFPGVLIDAFIIMPNHIHVIIYIQRDEISTNIVGGIVGAGHCPAPVTPPEFSMRAGQCPAPTGAPSKYGLLPKIINGYKNAVTKQIRSRDFYFQWQRNYYEHIIRDERDYWQVINYIKNNPAKWWRDRNNLN